MIEEQDIERLKEIFVTRRECDNSMDEVNKKLANDSTELVLIKQQLNTISWVAKTTLASVIGLLVTYIGTTLF
jgi:hypothetical protein